MSGRKTPSYLLIPPSRPRLFLSFVLVFVSSSCFRRRLSLLFLIAVVVSSYQLFVAVVVFPLLSRHRRPLLLSVDRRHRRFLSRHRCYFLFSPLLSRHRRPLLFFLVIVVLSSSFSSSSSSPLLSRHRRPLLFLLVIVVLSSYQLIITVGVSSSFSSSSSIPFLSHRCRRLLFFFVIIVVSSSFSSSSSFPLLSHHHRPPLHRRSLPAPAPFPPSFFFVSSYPSSSSFFLFFLLLFFSPISLLFLTLLALI